MCPVAAESKNSKPSSKKKINKKMNTKLETVVEEDSNKNNQTLQTSAELNESSIEKNNNEFSDSEEEDKGLGNIKLGPKGIYTEDSIRVYLQEIGRIRLLRPDEEIELARKIADLLQLEELATQYESEKGHFTSVREWAELLDMPLSKFRRRLLLGRRAKEKMVQSNLRLVVSVAKKYQGKGLELLDLVQEGSLGLERAVEKFDPTRGYKFSTYAFWWIRQSMTRAIACQSRTIRLPVHLSERLASIRKVSRDLAHKLGAMPSRIEIAEAMEIDVEELDSILRQALSTSSLDAPVNGDDGRSFLGDLIADSNNEEPLDQVEQKMYQEQLGKWLSHLSEQEQHVLKLRFGLEANERHTLAEIGRLLEVSRERVRQVELKALRKLRNMTRKLPSGI